MPPECMHDEIVRHARYDDRMPGTRVTIECKRCGMHFVGERDLPAHEHGAWVSIEWERKGWFTPFTYTVSGIRLYRRRAVTEFLASYKKGECR